MRVIKGIIKRLIRHEYGIGDNEVKAAPNANCVPSARLF